MNLFDVRKLHDVQDSNCVCLEKKLQSAIDSIEKKHIETEIKCILNSFSDNDVITVVGKRKYDFKTQENLGVYLNQDNNEIVQVLVKLYIKQLALYKLSCRECAMPLTASYDRKVQFDINHDGGNTIFLVTLNFLSAFDEYLLLNRKIEA